MADPPVRDGPIFAFTMARNSHPTPEMAEASAVPANDGVWHDDDMHVCPARPEAKENEPQSAVGHAHAWATRCAPEVGQLLPKGEVF